MITKVTKRGAEGIVLWHMPLLIGDRLGPKEWLPKAPTLRDKAAQASSDSTNVLDAELLVILSHFWGCSPKGFFLVLKVFSCWSRKAFLVPLGKR